MLTKLALLTATALSLSACVGSPVQYESQPVVLDTTEGKVTCQLYTVDQVIWDRAIDRPGSMSVATADNLCRKEGLRQQQAVRG